MTLSRASIEELENQIKRLEIENQTLRTDVEFTKKDHHARSLQEALESLKILWGDAPGMIYRAMPDNRHRLLWVDGDCLSLTGYTAAELTQNKSLSYINLILPPYRHKVIDALQDCITRQQSFNIVYPIQTREGKIRYVKQGGWPDQTENPGAVEGFVGDVTACITAKENNLHFHQDSKYLSESMYRFVNLDPETDILEFLADELGQIDKGLIIALFLYDHTNQILKPSRIIGADINVIEDVLGTSLFGIQMEIPEEELRRNSKAGGVVASSLEVFELGQGLVTKEKAAELKDKLNIQSFYSTLLEYHNKVYGAALVCITDEAALNRLEIVRVLVNILPVAVQRQEDAQKLRENAFTFNSFLEQSKDGILLVNDQGIVQVWSRGQETITGFTRDEIIGKPIWEVHKTIGSDGPEMNEMFNGKLEKYRQEPDPSLNSTWDTHLREFSIRHKNGESVFVQSVFFPVQSTNGVMIGSISRDITREKRHHREMEIIISLNRALRSATTRSQVLDVVIQELKSLVEVK